jgi:hypothetical protein
MDKIEVIDYGFDDSGEFGLETVSLVDKPAIEVDFVKFNKVKLTEVNQERMMVFGPALIPDQLIYRVDEETGREFYARFRSPIIEKAAHHILKKGNHIGSNIDHDTAKKVEAAFIAESWIKWSSDNDKSNWMGFDLPVGTWFIGMKIEDPEVWEKIKNKEVNGFSIEGMFRLVASQLMNVNMSEEMTDEEKLFLDVNNLFAEAKKLI